MKRYIGLLSEMKDITEKNQIDVDAYVSIAKKYQGKILEIGSRGGNISIGLANEGYDVTCLEIHRDMIYLHEEKLEDHVSDNTAIILGDFCSFDLNEKFDLIIAAKNVINSIKSSDDMMRMLTSVKGHLSDIGVFVIECDYPNLSKMKKNHGMERKDLFTNPRTEMNVESRVTSIYNFEELTRHDKIIVTEYQGEKIRRRIQLIQDYKIWMANELRSFFDSCGLHLMLESGNINEIEPITDSGDYMIFFLKS